MRRMSLPIPLVAACLLILGCQDDPELVAPDRFVSLQVVPLACTPGLVPDPILQVRPGSPPLETMDTTFHAESGQDQRLKIRFDGQGGPGTHTWFARLRLRRNTLLQPAADIQVTVDQASDGTVLFSLQFQPPLDFNADEPAELEFHLAQAEDVAELESLRIFRQEADGDPFECFPSELDIVEATVKAELDGFTRYALAIGR